MPKMLLTEDEAADIRKQREVKALQAVTWNEAIDMCIAGIEKVWGGDGTDRLHRDTFIDNLRAQKRNLSGFEKRRP